MTFLERPDRDVDRLLGASRAMNNATTQEYLSGGPGHPPGHPPGPSGPPIREKARSTRGIEVATDILRGAVLASGALDVYENFRDTRALRDLPDPPYSKWLPHRWPKNRPLLTTRNLAMPSAKVLGGFLLLQKIEQSLADREVRRAELEYMADTSHRGPRY